MIDLNIFGCNIAGESAGSLWIDLVKAVTEHGDVKIGRASCRERV